MFVGVAETTFLTRL